MHCILTFMHGVGVNGAPEVLHGRQVLLTLLYDKRRSTVNWHVEKGWGISLNNSMS